MKSNVVLVLNEAELKLLREGHYVTQTIPTYAKEKDERGGLFRKILVTVIIHHRLEEEENEL